MLGIYHDFLIGAPLRLIGFAILPERKPKVRGFPVGAGLPVKRVWGKVVRKVLPPGTRETT